VGGLRAVLGWLGLWLTSTLGQSAAHGSSVRVHFELESWQRDSSSYCIAGWGWGAEISGRAVACAHPLEKSALGFAVQAYIAHDVEVDSEGRF
jgi:hypothetical protein